MTIPPEFLHFERLGLQRNPFGSLTQAEEDALILPIPEIETWSTMSDSVQWMGEKGRGKTSLLRATLLRMAQTDQLIGYDSLPEGQSRLTVSLDDVDVMAVDEAQRLSLWQKHRLFRRLRKKRLLLTTHQDLGLWFRLYGIPYQTIQVAQFIMPERVTAMINNRIAFFARDEGPLIDLTEEAFAWLWSRYGDDIRSTEQALYEVFQSVHEPGPITGLLIDRILSKKQR